MNDVSIEDAASHGAKILFSDEGRCMIATRVEWKGRRAR